MGTFFLLYATVFTLTTCSTTTPTNGVTEAKSSNATVKKSDLSGKRSSVFASGCFWCVEAIFESVEGVEEAVSGYAGGSAESANYQQVSAGRTKHAEAVEVFYDPEVVSYETLLEVFFGSHDPTTLNQQGPDRGTQYRSTIFYKNEEEKIAAENFIAQLKKDEVFDGPITTTLESLDTFYDAEAYHLIYEVRNPYHPYGRGVSVPRLNRFKSTYPHLLKKGNQSH